MECLGCVDGDWVWVNSVQSMRRPELFWMSAGAPLVSVILSTILVFAFKAQRHGISVVLYSVSSQVLVNSYVGTVLIRDHIMFMFMSSVDFLDWEITRRPQPSLLGPVAFPWQLSGSCDQDWTHHRHHLPHCEWTFNIVPS